MFATLLTSTLTYLTITERKTGDNCPCAHLSGDIVIVQSCHFQISDFCMVVDEIGSLGVDLSPLSVQCAFIQHRYAPLNLISPAALPPTTQAFHSDVECLSSVLSMSIREGGSNPSSISICHSVHQQHTELPVDLGGQMSAVIWVLLASVGERVCEKVN